MPDYERPDRPLMGAHSARYNLRTNIMAYTLKKSIVGLSFEDIKRIYDNNPSMTLRELSNLTGLAVPFLKSLLMQKKV